MYSRASFFQRAYYISGMGIAENIKRLRKASGLTQAELAAKMGTIQKVISDYENGRAKPPRDRLPLLARIFGTTVDQLLGHDALAQPQAKPINKNKRTAKLVDAFEKLSPTDQRVILNQTRALAQEKSR